MAEGPLSAEEIVRRVLDTERSIESFRVEEARVHEKGGERTEEHSLRIRVGDDAYGRFGKEPPWDEELAYKGVGYYRTAAWKARDEFAGSTLRAGSHQYADRVEIGRVKSSSVVHEVPVDRPSGWDEDLLSTTYVLDFNQFLDAAVLDERTMGERRVVGLSVENTIPTALPFDEIESGMFPSGGTIEDPEGKLEKFREELRENLKKLPDTMSHKQVVWIGVDDYRVYRVETSGAEYRHGVEIGTHSITQTYSLYNEAELPGPLP